MVKAVEDWFGSILTRIYKLFSFKNFLSEAQKKELEKSIENLEKEKENKGDVEKVINEIQEIGF